MLVARPALTRLSNPGAYGFSHTSIWTGRGSAVSPHALYKHGEGAGDIPGGAIAPAPAAFVPLPSSFKQAYCYIVP